jgi:hypothetical protein
MTIYDKSILRGLLTIVWIVLVGIAIAGFIYGKLM